MLSIDSGISMLPHDSKIRRGSEDACFVFENWVGIADGVGSWYIEKKVDAGIFARELMSNCKDILIDGQIHKENLLTENGVLAVMSRAVRLATKKGSSTMLLSGFDSKNNTLNVGNVGDSGFLVIRGGEVVARSTPRMWSPNCPFQVANGAGANNDDPLQAGEFIKVELRDKDVIVYGSDGLFDNLPEEHLVEACVTWKRGPETLAEHLVCLAKLSDIKPDDITAVVSIVSLQG